jgi:hypothetical protein
VENIMAQVSVHHRPMRNFIRWVTQRTASIEMWPKRTLSAPPAFKTGAVPSPAPKPITPPALSITHPKSPAAFHALGAPPKGQRY